MEERIKKILAGILEIPASEIRDGFGPDSCAKWDSFNNLRIVSALEREFAVALSWPEISSMTDFSRIREVLAGHGGGR